MTARDRLRSVFAEPTWPLSVARPVRERHVGLEFDTAWARTPPARLARAMVIDNITRPLAHLVAQPRTYGLEHLDAVGGPAVFVANHSSHLDTAVILSVLPPRVRHRIVVAAAADYFFDRTWKANLWALVLGAVPVERSRINRRSGDLTAQLIAEGWSLLIFPEGGRSPDGWGQEFSPASAAYLSRRCEVPVVPMHLRGMRPLLPKGRGTVSPGEVELRVGRPLRAENRPDGRPEDPRRYSERIEQAVALLAAEAESDWWRARRAAASGTAAAFRGPQAAPWRRAWTLPESARTRRNDRSDSRKPW